MSKITKESSYSLSDKESLIVEVLIARHRLGERVWTFSSNVQKQLNLLSEKGLVSWKHGVIEDTCLAWLTDLGKAVYLSYPYAFDPSNKVAVAASKPLTEIQQEAAAIKKRINQQEKDKKN